MPTEFKIVLMLRRMIINPTNMPNFLWSIFLVINAAIGAAAKPPIIRGTADAKSIFGSARKKVIEMLSVTKNSARLTEPMAFLGCVFVIISEGVATGPHPPPPIASTKAAINPRGASLLILGTLYSVSPMPDLIFFKIIMAPITSNIPETNGFIIAAF